ncbi:pentatricopeptide repeat-containing protein At1g62680, mitochondrial-like [Zingiber officinale]|uniref:Pentatricopeptide repeat-containing protein n=1 Tax=Zingiber officinale TaxID=94328 RepID=A0A8J5HMR9_ZINOF|nr:pentatricopeptide repeat-containing protein At1g62680, mitochondrial-like [Zingiber officinale]KAG6531067.1 hypothetical protein ZIOFF_004837 [Zingiber officinale]
MSSLHAPFSLVPVLSSPRRLLNEFLLYDSSLVDKYPSTANFRRGKSVHLKALFCLRRMTLRSAVEPKFLDFRRHRGLGTQTEVDLLSSVVEVGGMEEKGGICDIATEESEVIKFEKNDNRFRREEFELIEEEAFGMIVEAGDGKAKDKEQDANVNYAKEESQFCLKKVGSLDAVCLVKIFIKLPLEERVKILDLFESDERNLTISDYNDILKALMKAGEYEHAVNFFSKLPCEGIAPDFWTYSIMVHCFCKKNEPDKAMQTLEDILERGYRPNHATFSCLINCLSKRGRMKKAFKVFELMLQTGYGPSIREYNSLIRGLCYVGRLEEAFELLKKIKSSSTQPGIYTYTLLIDGFCMVGRCDDAMELLKEAEEIGLVPDIVTCNSVLNGYCKAGRPLEGHRLLKKMQRGDCQPDFISYTIILQGMLRQGEVSAAWRIYKEMRDAGFVVDERCMNTLLRGICRQPVIDDKVLKDANELFELIKEVGHDLSPYTYCLMVQALARGGEVDKALFHLHEIARNGYSPRMMTFNVILRILCEQGRCDDAISVLVLMIDRDRIPSKFSFSILLSALCGLGRVLEAFGVYAAAVKRSVVPHWKPPKGLNMERVFQ